MAVRIVRLRYPRPGDRIDQPHEEVLTFDRAYQLGDRVIAVDPEGEVKSDKPRQFTRDHLIEVDFDAVDVISYGRMVNELGGEIEQLSGADVDQTVERLV